MFWVVLDGEMSFIETSQVVSKFGNAKMNIFEKVRAEWRVLIHIVLLVQSLWLLVWWRGNTCTMIG